MRTPRVFRSLRVQLTALGLVPAVLTLLVLLLVAVVTQDVDVRSGPTGTVTVEDEARGVSPWVPVTAGVLALAAAVAAWWWAGRAVGPIRDVADLAERTGAGALDRRLHLTGAATEVQTLADGVDRMLDRLAAASAVQRRLTEDASHELRTPLAVLATTADVILERPDATEAQYREAMERMRRTVDRMSVTVDTLLGRARASQAAFTGESADLTSMARRVAAEHAATARAREVDVTVTGEGAVTAAFDAFSVERAVSNLVDNAVRHSPPGRAVQVEVGSSDGRAFVSVTDAGPGIPPADQQRVFDRYWRGDTAGTGIGLSIVRLVADAHDGVEVTSPVGDGAGTRFTMWFRGSAAES